MRNEVDCPNTDCRKPRTEKDLRGDGDPRGSFLSPLDWHKYQQFLFEKAQVEQGLT